MKPKSQSELSSPDRVNQDAMALSAPVTEVSDDVEPQLTAEVLGPQAARPPRRRRPAWRRAFSISILGVAILAGGLLAMHVVGVNKRASANTSSASLQVKPQTIPLNNLHLQPLSSLSQTNALTVNGNVDVNSSVVLSPTAAPTGAVAGQLYFDQQKNQLGYFNGTSFMYIQGGAGGLAANNITNVHNVNNVTNVTNIYNFTNAVTGPPGVIPMFDGTGLTDSMISQVGDKISTGTGVENVTIGSTNGASNTVVQGGTGNVSINTGAVTGTSGAITIESGASSTTAAGNVNIDTGGSIINGTLIADKTFEDGTTDNMGDGIFGDNSTVSLSTAQAHGGSYSLAISVGSGFYPSWAVGDGTGTPPYTIPVVAGHTYALQSWVRAGTNSDTITASVIWSNDGYGGGGEISQQDFGTVTDVSSGWRKVAGVLTAPIGAVRMGFYFSSSDAQTVGEVHYFDDITVTDLTTAPVEATLNLGTTNAQAINIGNAGMLAPTTIDGGGVTISGGSGFINETGGYLTLAGTTGGSISTSTGALTLSSGTSASWGVGGSTYSGGDLTLHAGSAGGNNNGGNLYLEGGAGAGTGTTGSVIVKPPADTTSAFQVQNSSGTATMLNVSTANTQVINDNMISSAPTGTFVRGASWVSGQYVELDNGGPGVDGEVNYPLTNVGASFNASFDFWSKAGGGDGTFLYAYDQRVPATFHLGAYYGGAGYIFAYADTILGSYAGIYYDGTQLASAPISTTDTSTWHTAQVTKVGDQFTMYLDGNSVLTYTDTVARDISGTNFGVGGCSCSYNGEHRATNLVMSGDPFVTTGGSAQLGGNVTIVGSLSASAISTNQISTANGLTIKPWNNSTSAFSIQSAYDATLFSVDSTNAVITVAAKLQVNGNLVLDGHFQTSGTTPSIAAGAAACTGSTVSIAGNDTAGTITVNTGTGCTGGGTLATVTFANAFGIAPIVELTPGSPISQTLGAYVDDSTISTTSFDLGTNATPMASQTFKWNYLVVQ